MSCHPRVTEWTTIIQAHLPHLITLQATVLALWSLGMVLGSLLCVDRRQCLPGDLAGPQRTRRVPAVARVVLRGRRPTRARPVRARRGALLWAAAGLGSWGSGRARNRPWLSMPQPWGSRFTVLAIRASITASATFGHSASPDNVTCWHIMALQ